MHANTFKSTGLLQSSVITRAVEKHLLLVALIILDLAMISVGFWVAYILRFETAFPWVYQPDMSPLYFYQRLVFFLSPLWIVVFWLFRMYEFKNLFRGKYEYMQVFNAGTLGIMLVILSTFFDPNFIIARGWVIPDSGPVVHRHLRTLCEICKHQIVCRPHPPRGVCVSLAPLNPGEQQYR